MKLIVGLGNPEARYMRHRHNAGRLAVVRLVDSLGGSFRRERMLQASFARLEEGGRELIAAYPETYMNLSGEAVVKLVRQFDVDPVSDLLVVVDDVAIPFARLRLRARGSSGGHNGLRSVDERLATTDYARLRIGVGHPGDLPEGEGPKPEVRDYVLSDFSPEEEKAMPELLDRAVRSALLWASRPIEQAMTDVNSGW